jgi:type VI secretion system protein ImpG
MRNTQPQYLCPIPAATIIAFTPKANCMETHIIPAGSEVASVPIDGTSCRFTTVWPVELHPLALLDAAYTRPPGRPAVITLALELKGMRLADWEPETVCLFLSGEYGHAADLYLLLTRWLRKIIIEAEDGGTPAVLDKSHLKPVGFDSEHLFPAPSRGVCNDIVREFSILPEKHLFLDLNGWDAWRDRGEGGRFEVRFELNQQPFPLGKVTTADFTIFAAPAVNVFSHKARPILLTGEDIDYPVIPEGGKPGHFSVYSIEKVLGILDGAAEKVPFTSTGSFGSNSVQNPVYREMRSESMPRQGYETTISMKLPPQAVQRQIKTLSAELLCTNGILAERLRIGDVREETDKSPGYASFTNCKPVTSPLFDTLGDNRLWRLFGMQFINLKLLTTASLRAALRLLYVSAGQDRQATERNEEHIEGIQGLTVDARDRIVRQVMKRGWTIRIKLDPECFRSPGDRYLFGAMLDHFLRGFVSEAYFTRTIIEDVRGGIEYELPTKMGRRALV